MMPLFLPCAMIFLCDRSQSPRLSEHFPITEWMRA